MNLRNRYLAVSIRILFGALLVFSGIGGLISGRSTEGIPPDMITIMQSLWSSGLFHMIKITEVIAGIMLVVGFWPALAALFVAPIAIGIIVFNSLLAPNYVFAGVIVGLFDAYLGYVYWEKYKPLFSR